MISKMFSKLILYFIHKPGLALAVTFAGIIFIGTGLLLLPQATVSGDISFIDALFTAVSAVCVTGLTVLDTGTDFTFFGQIVILGLIQVGALGIMTAAAFFVLILHRKIRIGYQAALRRILDMDFMTESVRIIKFIVISTFIIEIIGAFILFFFWDLSQFSWQDKAFYSIFHAVSAFGNAGFSLFSDNLTSFNGDVVLNIVIMSLIVLGGLGFIVLVDFKKCFWGIVRHNYGFRYFHIHTKIMIVATAILIIIGAVGFFIFEKNNPDFSAHPIISSFFQSITARTAGFNTVNIGALSSPSYLLLMALMFIGGGAGSTAGGVKVTTVAILFILVISFIRRRKEVSIFGRTLTLGNIFSAVAVFFFAISVLFPFLILLLYMENGSFREILFEAISAFGTVGLSMGITPHLTFFGKMFIIILMFIGRIGPLAIILITVRETENAIIKYPHERVVVG